MVNYKELIKFFLFKEAGVKPEYLNLPFEEAFAHAVKSGYADDPVDRGGATMCGVTIATYTEYCRRKGRTKPTKAQLRNLTAAEWLDIFITMFWNSWKADQIKSQPIANILVDWVWASGPGVGIKTPQRILGVKADGIVGPKTLAALNSQDPEKLFGIIHQARINHIEAFVKSKPAQKRFYNGWMNRINSITYEGLKIEI